MISLDDLYHKINADAARLSHIYLNSASLWHWQRYIIHENMKVLFVFAALFLAVSAKRFFHK